ncbi:MAG: hypothetical protein MUE33_10950 [Cytophagaceae bacterium]|jgi:hypothetical protein|nr:hypothetical protein [Cytophagaceae bacterium]
MYFLLILHWLLSTNIQNSESSLNFQKRTVDSLVQVIDSEALVPYKSEEHHIKPEYHHTLHKTFSTFYFKDERTKDVTKIVHMESHVDYRITTYYFNNKNLILIKVLERLQKAPQTAISGNYYYENNALIFKEEFNGTPSVNPNSLANAARDLTK